MDQLHEKYENLKVYLKSLGSVAVAFSSGVDSTFLLKVAHDVLGDKAIAVTAASCSFPERELNEAKKFCAENGIQHIVCESEELDIDGFRQNPKNRCYLCKKELFENKALGWVFRQVHGFPVDRGNMDMGAIRTAMGVLKAGETLGIFPEGTRSKSGHMLPLLGGASLLALKSGCDVVPVYIEGHYKPFRRMVVHVGTPIEMADLRAGRMNKETCDALTERMEAAFARLSGGKSLPPAEKTPA